MVASHEACEGGEGEGDSDMPLDLRQLQGVELSYRQISVASSDSSLGGSVGASFQEAYVQVAEPQASLVPFSFQDLGC